MDPQKILNGDASCTDIVKCLFGLTDFELVIYRRLVKQGPQKADEMAPILRRDRSTVYRGLQKLISSGLAFRDTKSIERGGYYHVYSAVSPEQLKNKLHKCADDWFDNMNKAIEEFDLA